MESLIECEVFVGNSHVDEENDDYYYCLDSSLIYTMSNDVK